MDWELILKTYPDDREGIVLARAICDEVNKAVKDIDISGVDIFKISSSNYIEIIPVLIKIGETVWEAHYKTKPAFDMKATAEAFLKNSNINALEKDIPVIGVLLNNALRAILKKIRVISPEPEKLVSGSCSFCGAYARIIFDEENQRTLFCPLCGFSWRYPRVRCTVCGNTNNETLGYMEAEGLDGVRAYFCRECNHFIKAVDIKNKLAADAETMDAITLEIDELAGEEGFIPVP